MTIIHIFMLTIGNYESRGSTFADKLTGPITAPEGFTVYYRTDIPESDPAAAISSSNWTTTVDDYTKVTAFKVVMNPNVSIASGERVECIVTMKAPDFDINKSINKYKAINAAAVSLDNGSQFGQTNNVYNQMNISIPVKKTLIGLKENSVDVQLYNQNVAMVGKVITLDDNSQWSGIFSNLTIYDAQGNENSYSVNEVLPSSLQKYNVSITGNSDSGFTIENKYIPEKTVQVQKYGKEDHHQGQQLNCNYLRMVRLRAIQ